MGQVRAVSSSLVCALVLLYGCSGDDRSMPITDAGERDGEVPDSDMPDVALDSRVPADDSGASGTAYPIYLDFAGERFDTLRGEAVAVPPFIEPPDFAGVRMVAPTAFEDGWRLRRDALMADVVERVAEIFAPFDVEVVTRQPDSGGYATIIVGGTVGDSGDARPECSIQGHARLLCGAPDRDRGVRRGAVHTGCFVAVPTSELRERLAHVISHELGHVFGLEHADSGGFMAPSGGPEGWGSGMVLDDDSMCRSGVQDSAAVLLSQLGERRARAPLPAPSDTSSPEMLAWPHAAVVSAETTSPCVSVRDDSGVEAVYLQVFAMPAGAPPDQPWVFLTQQWLDGGDGPDFRFAPVDLTGWRDVAFRYTASDQWGNLGEVRERVRVDPSAPVVDCP